jgi:hypothetical protein
MDLIKDEQGSGRSRKLPKELGYLRVTVEAEVALKLEPPCTTKNNYPHLLCKY